MSAGKTVAIRGLLIGASLLAFALPVAAQAQAAQAADDTGVGDIIVTAQRRAERLQDVPISVSAVTTEELKNRGVQNTLDLVQVVPSLNMTSQAGATQVRIRGVGTTNFGPGVENPVAIYVDGVYIASTSGAFFNLANIERVEALKGPQGTLFGRNATGGLIQVITPEPGNKLGGFIRAGYANYDTFSGDLYVTAPLGEKAGADLAVHYAHEGKGWGHNINTGAYVNQISSDLIVRSKIRLEPTENLKLILAGDYSRLLGSRPVTLQQLPGTFGAFDAFNGFKPHGGFYDNDSFVNPRALIQSGGGSLTATLKVGEAEVKSITAYRTTRFQDRFALTRVPQDILIFDGQPKWDQFSQELQVNGKTGRLKYTAGAYYFMSIDKYDPFFLSFGKVFSPIAVKGSTDAFQQFNDRLKTSSIAVYAQATYELADNTNLTLGGRYTDETKDVSGTQRFWATFPVIGTIDLVPAGTPYLPSTTNPHLHNTNFSYRIALDHKFSNDVMVYVSYNTGFKSGGYNLTTPANPAYLPEKLSAVEVGIKSELFDRHLRLNLSAFHYDYTNMQVNQFILSSTYIVNGGRSKVDGFELEAEAKVAPGLTINAGLAYTNARFTDFPNAGYNYVTAGCVTNTDPATNGTTPCTKNAAGNKLPNSPEFTGNIGFAYEHSFKGGKLGLTGNVYHSSSYFGTFDNDPRAHQQSYEVVNGSIWFEPGDLGLRVTGWVKNLLDKQYTSNLYISSQQTVLQAAAPRTYGITIEKKF